MPDHDALDGAAVRELAAVDDALAGRPVAYAHRELADLALLLHAERPRIDPEFASSLDVRAAEGFTSSRREGARRTSGRRRTRRAFRRVHLLPALATALLPLIVMLVVLTGDSSGPDQPVAGGAAVQESRQSDASGGGVADTEPGAGTASSVEPPIGPPPVPGGGSRGDGRENRRVERSATLTLAAPPEEIDRVADGIVRVTDAVGGFVSFSTVASGASGEGGGSFELRVPAPRLARALAELSRLAHVRERSQATQDITAQVVTGRARVRDARAERRQLLRLLEKAGSPAETVTIRRRLQVVGDQLDAARTDVARTLNRAAFSSIAVTLLSDADAQGVGVGPDDGRWGPGDALSDAGRVLEVAAGVALVALAVAAPLTVLAVAAALAARTLTRRRRERALDAV